MMPNSTRESTTAKEAGLRTTKTITTIVKSTLRFPMLIQIWLVLNGGKFCRPTIWLVERLWSKKENLPETGDCPPKGFPIVSESQPVLGTADCGASRLVNQSATREGFRANESEAQCPKKSLFFVPTTPRP